MLDKRIGENDPELSVEEKMLARFAAEKKVCRLYIYLCESPRLRVIGR